LPDLPAKRRELVAMHMSEAVWKKYNRAKTGLIEALEDNQSSPGGKLNMHVFSLMHKLHDMVVDAKLVQCMKWIEDYLECGNKLVVFAIHKKVIALVMDKFAGRVVKVDGSVTGIKRQEAVDRFQQDEGIRLFAGNIKAAGEGITLTAAQDTCFLEFDWTPGMHQQAEDRVHRIGQTASSCIAYYLAVANTIEEVRINTLTRKQSVLDGVLDGEAGMDAMSFKELLETLKKH